MSLARSACAQSGKLQETPSMQSLYIFFLMGHIAYFGLAPGAFITSAIFEAAVP